MRQAIMAGLIVACALPVVPASAQLQPGYSGSSSTLTFSGEETYRTLRSFGSCFALRYPAEAFALIATEPASRAEADTYRRLFRRDNQACLGEDTEVRVAVNRVRGVIAEGLYKRGVAVPPNLVVPAPATGEVRTLSEAARCYTAVHRDQARRLIEETRPGSREEFAALRQMAPDFFRCVPETARGRSFDTTLIRFRLVEALLRMPAAPAGQR